MMRRIISGKMLSSFLIAAVAFALLTPAITLAGEYEIKSRSYRGEDNSFIVGGISLTYSF